ncbi:MAG: hypothetical protein ABSF26_10250 [Thermoguttaceae bacterium]|jgi:hypothetical protein
MTWFFSRTSALTALVVFSVLVAIAPAAAETVTDLHVRQAIERGLTGYRAEPEVRISFRLAAEADVSITVARHDAQSRWNPTDTRIRAIPAAVRILNLGNLTAGVHKAVWDGLDEQGQPVVEPQPAVRWPFDDVELPTVEEYLAKRAADPRRAATPLTAEELILRIPVTTVRITVRAGNDLAAVNFDRLPGVVPAWSMANGFYNDGFTLPDGDLLVMNYMAWHGEQLTPGFKLRHRYPRFDAAWASNLPTEGTTVCVGPDGSRYFGNVNGILKYTADGTDGVWQLAVFVSTAEAAYGPKAIMCTTSLTARAAPSSELRPPPAR